MVDERRRKITSSQNISFGWQTGCFLSMGFQGFCYLKQGGLKLGRRALNKMKAVDTTLFKDFFLENQDGIKVTR